MDVNIHITVESSDYLDDIGIFNTQENGMAFSISLTYLLIKSMADRGVHKCL